MANRLAQAYHDKKTDYFEGVRHDIIDDLPSGVALTILDIGCGSGATLAQARLRGKAAYTVGIEVEPGAAARARTRIDKLLEGDVERMKLPFEHCFFDVIILSEILEHLVDPWGALERLRPVLKPGGLIYTSSPNVAHITVLKALLRNRWDYCDEGRFDRTHLRWFTPATYRQMIERAGFEVIWLRAIAPMTTKQAVVNALTLDRLSHLFISQIFVKARRHD
jgi:SAM-dependent methyltransferase